MVSNMPADEQRRYGSIMSAGADLLQQIQVAVIRVDGKMDNLNTRFGDFRDSVNAELKALRDVQKDQEERLRKLQERDYVSPATVWKVVGALFSAAGILITIFFKLVP